MGAKQESFVDSHEGFKETTRQKLASLELNSNWGGEFDRISQRLDHIEDRHIVMESRATGVPVEEVVKKYYNAPPAEDDDEEETYEVVEFEDAPANSRFATLPVNDEHVTRRAPRISRESVDTKVLSEPMSSSMKTSPERTPGIAGNNRLETLGEDLESKIHRAVDSAVKAILGTKSLSDKKLQVWRSKNPENTQHHHFSTPNILRFRYS